jgi:hypothetical protein
VTAQEVVAPEGEYGRQAPTQQIERLVKIAQIKSVGCNNSWRTAATHEQHQRAAADHPSQRICLEALHAIQTQCPKLFVYSYRSIVTDLKN